MSRTGPMCLRTRTTEWVSTHFAVVKSTVPLLSCRLFQTHPSWSRDRQGSCRVCFFLEGKLIGVCSLLTSMRVLGSQLVRGDCSAKRPKSNPLCGVAGVELAERKRREGAAIGLCKCWKWIREWRGKRCVKQSATKHG